MDSIEVVGSTQSLEKARIVIQAAVESLFTLIEEHNLDTDGDLSRALEVLKNRLGSNEVRLAVLGEFSAGKTTFVNSLLNTDVLQTGILPTTSVCTYISNGSSTECEVLLRGGEVARITPDEVRTFSVEGSRSEEVVEVRLRLASPYLANGLIVIDTPGVNVNIDAHEAITDRAIKEANACVYLMDARQPGKKTTIDFLRRVQTQIDKFFFVLNRGDILDDVEQREATDFLREVLTEDCGIPNPHVAVVSAALARKGEGNWNRAFTELEDTLQAFMLNERQFVIATEVAAIASVVAVRTKQLLSNRWSLAEQELATYHKVRLPDSGELMENLRREVAVRVENDAASVNRELTKCHHDVVTSLRSSLEFEINYAKSKEELTGHCQQEIERHFREAGGRIQNYLVESFRQSFDTANGMVTKGVADLFQGITWLEERIFFSRPLPYIVAAFGALIGLVIVGALFSWSDAMWHSLSWALCTIAGGLAGLVVARFLWVKRVRFAAPTMESVDPSKFAAQASTGFLFGYETSVRPVMSGVGQAGLRFGINTGHPLLAAIGVGLAAIGELFSPNLEKLRKEVMTKSLHACDDFSGKTRNGASLFIEKGYEQVLSVLLQSIESTVRRYDGIISKLVRSQKSVGERLERRKQDLQSAVHSASLVKSELENAARSIHATLQGSQREIDVSETRRDGAVEDTVILQSDDSAFTPPQPSEMLFYGTGSAEAPVRSARRAARTLWWSTGIASIFIFVFGIVIAQRSAAASTSLLSGFWARFVESDSAKPSTPPTSIASTTNASQAAEDAQVSKPALDVASPPVSQPDALASEAQVPATSNSTTEVSESQSDESNSPATVAQASPANESGVPAESELNGQNEPRNETARSLNVKALHMLAENPPDLWGAKSTLETAVHLAPSDIEIQNNLGDIYGRIGDYRSAESVLTWVVSVAPTRRVAQGNLGYVEAKIGKVVDASNHFCQYIRLFKSMEQGKSTLVRVINDPDPNVQTAVNLTLSNCTQ